jgi:hypothetical protein
LAPPPELDWIARTHAAPLLGDARVLDLGDLALAQGGRIEGRVGDAEGAPVAGAHVGIQEASFYSDHSIDQAVLSRLLSSEGTWDPYEPRATSRADGTYSLRGVKPGMHSLAATKEGATERRDGVSVASREVDVRAEGAKVVLARD